MIGPVSLRWLALGVLYALLFAAGLALSRYLSLEAEMLAAPGEPFGLNKMVLMVLVIYVLASALPFVPGAEIGFVMMVAFGAAAALPVYLCMVAALCLAFCAGRLIPPYCLERAFRFLGLRRAADLVAQTDGLHPQQRLQVLSQHAPRAFVPMLLRLRYLALALAFNLPGNSVAGGGGGLAMFAGLSRLFGWPGFLATVAVAVAPVPAMVFFLG